MMKYYKRHSRCNEYLKQCILKKAYYTVEYSVYTVYYIYRSIEYAFEYIGNNYLIKLFQTATNYLCYPVCKGRNDFVPKQKERILISKLIFSNRVHPQLGALMKFTPSGGALTSLYYNSLLYIPMVYYTMSAKYDKFRKSQILSRYESYLVVEHISCCKKMTVCLFLNFDLRLSNNNKKQATFQSNLLIEFE